MLDDGKESWAQATVGMLALEDAEESDGEPEELVDAAEIPAVLKTVVDQSKGHMFGPFTVGSQTCSVPSCEGRRRDSSLRSGK